MTTTTITRPGRATNRALWTIQIVVGLFLIIASSAPKLLGERSTVAQFDQIGGQWLRWVCGIAELAGGIGLLVAPIAAAAAVGLVALMIGAAYTQLFVLDTPVLVITPILIGALMVVVAVGRRDRLREFLQSLRT